MKKSIALMSVSALAISGAAMASGDEVINLGNFTFQPGDVQTIDVPVTNMPNTKGIIGFSVSFDYFKNGSDASWASDLQMILTAPDNTTFDIGGLAGDEDVVANDWDFQGSGSTAPGFYQHTSDAALWAGAPKDKGDWLISLSDDWNGGSLINEWNNFTITFHKDDVPAPGALALLGLAGVAGMRRRRR